MKGELRTCKWIIIALFSFLALSPFLPPPPRTTPAWCESTNRSEALIIRDGKISADLRGISVAAIIQRLKKNCAICVYADKSILGETIYAKFANVPLQEGMARIFSGMNYILFFSQDGTLSEVALVGKKGLVQAEVSPVMPAEPDTFSSRKLGRGRGRHGGR